MSIAVDEPPRQRREFADTARGPLRSRVREPYAGYEHHCDLSEGPGAFQGTR